MRRGRSSAAGDFASAPVGRDERDLVDPEICFAMDADGLAAGTFEVGYLVSLSIEQFTGNWGRDAHIDTGDAFFVAGNRDLAHGVEGN